MAKPYGEALNELAEKAQAGDRRAFSTIVRQMMEPVAALTYRMTGDKETALDLAQETFVAAWQNLAGFRHEAGFASWLYRIAVNRTLNFLKTDKRQRAAGSLESLQSSAGADSPERNLVEKELAGGVRQFMLSLPEQQRLIFNLRFYSEMPFADIAEVTGRAIGTVKTGYREAVRKLRRHAREKGWR